MRVEAPLAVMGLAVIRLAVIGLAAILGSGDGVAAGQSDLRGTGDLGLVVERALGRVQVIETTGRTSLCTIEGLGDL